MAAAEPEPFTTTGIKSTIKNDKCLWFGSYPKYTNYFFWISHGESMSSLNHLQETKNTLPRTTLFGHALQLTGSDMLEYILKPSEQFDKDGLNVPIAHNLNWLLTCHKNTLHYRSDYVAEKKEYKSRTENTTYNMTKLPPLRFSVAPGYDEQTSMNNGLRFIDVIGLYHYSTKTQTFTKILNWVNLYQKNYWHYSDIFKAVRDTKDYGIDIDDAALGIYCCRSTTPKYALEYGNNFSMTSHAHPIECEIIHDEISLITNEEELNDSISPFLIENTNTTGGWSALGERTDQGCGLNVLSYFGLIPQRDAREMAVCLTKGTSIVEICRYVNDYLRLRNIIRTFVILRHTLNYALSTIMKTFVSLPFSGRWATFMKIYINSKHENIFNNRGHTFAFTIDKDDKGAFQIAFVDPQVGTNTLIFPNPNAPVDDPTAHEYIQMLESNIKEKYPFYASDETAADVIYIVDTSLNFESRHHTTKEQFEQIQPVTEANLFAEGTKRKKTRRRRKKKKKARRSRKYSERKR